MGQSVNQSGVLPRGGGVVTTSSRDGGTGDTPSSLATGSSRRDEDSAAVCVGNPSMADDAGTTADGAAAAAADKRHKARQRWKILCLVKASDTVADETARKERVQEKVDDWMRTMVRITKFHLP